MKEDRQDVSILESFLKSIDFPILHHYLRLNPNIRR